MTVYELVEKLGGEICRGRARVRINSDWIILGILNGDDMIFTEEGRRLAAEQNTEPPKEKKKAGRPAKEPVVESAGLSVDDSFDAVFKDLN
jgi:hypothetical protein